MPYTPEDQRRIHDLRTRAEMSGRSEIALIIKRLEKQDTPVAEIEAAIEPTTRVPVRPTVRNIEPIEPPPRTGPGSSADRWRAWMAAMSGMEADVLAQMGRADIILLAEEENIIDSEPVM